MGFWGLANQMLWSLVIGSWDSMCQVNWKECFWRVSMNLVSVGKCYRSRRWKSVYCAARENSYTFSWDDPNLPARNRWSGRKSHRAHCEELAWNLRTLSPNGTRSVLRNIMIWRVWGCKGWHEECFSWTFSWTRCGLRLSWALRLSCFSTSRRRLWLWVWVLWAHW